MDAKITKKRIGGLLSYDWLKIVAICVAAVILLLILFTSLATRVSAGQSFYVFTYIGTYVRTEYELEDMKESGALSYDILEYVTHEISETGYEDTILTTRMTTGDGDVLIAADTGDEAAEDGSLTSLSRLKEFLVGYSAYCAWLGTDGRDYSFTTGGYTYSYSNYFTACAAYLDRFYDAGYEEKVFAGDTDLDEDKEIDEDAARECFLARNGKDRRYRKDSAVEEGVADEIARIGALRDAFIRVWQSVNSEDGVIQVNTLEFSYDTDGSGEIDEDETYSWQMTFDLSRLNAISEYLYNAEGSTGGESLNMCVLSCGVEEDEEDLYYEPFTYLAWMVDTFNQQNGEGCWTVIKS